MKKIILILIQNILYLSIITPQAQTVNCQYDSINRLSIVNYGNGTILNYSYDEVGNRTAKVIQANLPIAILIVSPTSANVPASAGTLTIQIQNSGIGIMNWNATSNVSWLTISGNSSGTNNGSITINYQANAGSQRTGSITITANGAMNSPQNVYITQNAVLISDHLWHVKTTGNNITGNGSFNNPFKTIQKGIDTASVGDTVLVHSGVYPELINFNGKNITVCSNYLFSIDTNEIENTIIDGNFAGSVVSFINNENTTALFKGFTIRNGKGSFYIDSTKTWGGGIWLSNSSPRLSNLKIENCHTVYGAGIGMGNNANPVLTYIHLQNNIADTSGGAISCNHSSPLIKNCLIENNTSTYGGGILLYDNANANIINTIIKNNIAISAGGGMSINNQSSPRLTNLLVVKNYANYGTGIFIDAANPIIINSTISDNNPSIYNAVESSQGSNATIVNCIIWDNSQFSISNSILFSNIKGGFIGLGNINSNPLFVNPSVDNYHLINYSPCINSGIPDTLGLYLPSTDLAGFSRINQSIINMGAYEDMGININVNGVQLVNEINIFPNPMNDKLIIEMKGNKEKLSIEIYNSLSQIVFKGFIEDKTIVETSGFSKGLYLIKIKNNNYFILKKILKI